MARDISAYFCDIIDACNSISSIVVDISIDTYVATREKRSAEGCPNSGLIGSSAYQMAEK